MIGPLVPQLHPEGVGMSGAHSTLQYGFSPNPQALKLWHL
jgi:hypothetical protein